MDVIEKKELKINSKTTELIVAEGPGQDFYIRGFIGETEVEEVLKKVMEWCRALYPQPQDFKNEYTKEELIKEKIDLEDFGDEVDDDNT